LDVEIASIYRSLEQDMEETCPNARDRFHFIPPATDPMSWRNAHRDSASIESNVSWIASLVGDRFLDQLASHVAQHHEYVELFRDCLSKVSSSGYLEEFKHRHDVIALCASIGWELDFLEVHLQNIATNNDRTDAVEELSRRGLRLYGNDRWIGLLAHSRAVARSLMIGHKIASYPAQMEVYNGSKISINVPQIQAKTGMQYRILDVMASNSLLLTKHIENSDLDFVFNKSFPVPRFRSCEELGKFVDNFLEKEEERVELVDACHALIGPEFSFGHRVKDYLALSNPALRLEQQSSAARGTLNAIPASTFTNWTGPR
jgi:spore maturation protein CgeB